MVHRTRPWGVPVGALALALVAAACTGATSGGETPGGEAAAASAPGTYAIALTDFALDPDQVTAPAGQDLVFQVSNDGTSPHTFAVDTGDGLKETAQLQSGETATLTVPALAAGDYKILCTVPGHEDIGMVGTLAVSEDAPVAAGATGSAGATGATGHATTSHAGMTVQEMLEGHRAGVEAFPAETEGQGNQSLDPTIENGWKVFELTAQEVRWETEPGTFVDAMGFNGTVPGPELRVNPGDKVRIIVRNEMSQPTTMHLHGVTVPNGMDGVPYITQDPIMPGGFFTYEFEVVDPPGMYVYHSHFNSTEQVGKGLYGAIYIEPRGGFSAVYDERIEVESTLFLGDGPTGFVLNGKGFPATQPIVAKQGDDVLIHLANDGAQIHPMHLHGFHFEVVGQDGFVLEQPYMADTLMVAPGQRFDILVRADYPGVWAYHCHILPHVEGPGGMFGMVTALVVE
ncbi:MAG TPA: multicopper oxidase domain-containing protein [Actinomycetota bacterium]|nr:multicopper oxidase domain-containing protein [Actinomycetota bacterium]